jgi:hypothetical protein
MTITGGIGIGKRRADMAKITTRACGSKVDVVGDLLAKQPPLTG